MVCCANPEAYEELFDYASIQRDPALDFIFDQRLFGFFVQDWRKKSMVEWINNLNLKDIDPTALAIPVPEIIPHFPQQPPEQRPLTEDDFFDAVADALKHLDNPMKLTNSPLLRCRFVNPGELPDSSALSLALALTDKISGQIKRLEASARHELYYRVLHRTFINPAGNQIEIAEFLNMSNSTYRRQLKNAVQWIVDMLWIEENQLLQRLPGT